MAQRAATRADVDEVAPELAAATDEQVAVALRVTAHLVWPPRWRLLASDAHALLAAHFLATQPGLGLGPGGGDLEEFQGVTTAIADGPASRSFGPVVAAGAAAWDDAMLATTAYGRMFLQLRKAQRGFGAFMTAGGTFPA